MCAKGVSTAQNCSVCDTVLVDNEDEAESNPLLLIAGIKVKTHFIFCAAIVWAAGQL